MDTDAMSLTREKRTASMAADPAPGISVDELRPGSKGDGHGHDIPNDLSAGPPQDPVPAARGQHTVCPSGLESMPDNIAVQLR